jgi:hypothetical protein
MEYTYGSYRALLSHIHVCGRAICPFRDVTSSESFVILRHDVDYSVLKAREMAEVEREMDVRSTFFVLLSSPYYNLLTADNLHATRDIAAMGHEIGLHYDTDVFRGLDHDAQCRKVVDQVQMLREAVGVPITSIAQHNPSETSVRLRVPGYIDAYSDRFFREIAYLSDSRRLFGAPDVDAFFRQHARSQLLIHPLWWHDDEKSRWESFVAIRDSVTAIVDRHLTRMNASMEADERKVKLGRR